VVSLQAWTQETTLWGGRMPGQTLLSTDIVQMTQETTDVQRFSEQKPLSMAPPASLAADIQIILKCKYGSSEKI
jgi:hypothetical protein